ncbi:MAG: FMN-binding protein [Clostridia bacterium]|nr:FMN-binding protein [Clostridia bacterium]
MKVKVTMDGDRIAKVEVLSSSETPGICDPAMEQIPKAIVEAQSTEVDAVTNATQSSQAIMEAVRDALRQIR